MEAIAALVSAQQGVVRRSQLRRRGWTDGHVDHEIAVGRWSVPVRGVVALQNTHLSPDQLPWLGVLHAGRGAALSHLTAARAAGLRWTGREVVDVITPRGDLVPALPGFFFHQTRRPFDRWLVDGPGPPRLRLEHAALLAAERDRSLRRAIGLLAACVQQQLTDADALLRAAAQIRKLRHGHLFALALGDIAGGAQSFAEIDLGRLTEAAGLMAPTRQALRHDGDRIRYLDCEWRLADGRVIVLEIDGSFHLEVGSWWRDMKRERGVALSSTTVLRCASVEIRLEPHGIVADLRRAGVPSRHRFVHVS
jgi:hypothetical protein